jgi:hypothetical protein
MEGLGRARIALAQLPLRILLALPAEAKGFGGQRARARCRLMPRAEDRQSKSHLGGLKPCCSLPPAVQKHAARNALQAARNVPPNTTKLKAAC